MVQVMQDILLQLRRYLRWDSNMNTCVCGRLDLNCYSVEYLETVIEYILPLYKQVILVNL